MIDLIGVRKSELDAMERVIKAVRDWRDVVVLQVGDGKVSEKMVASLEQGIINAIRDLDKLEKNND